MDVELLRERRGLWLNSSHRAHAFSSPGELNHSKASPRQLFEKEPSILEHWLQNHKTNLNPLRIKADSLTFINSPYGYYRMDSAVIAIDNKDPVSSRKSEIICVVLGFLKSGTV